MFWINFKKREVTKKKTSTWNTWYDWYGWLISYISEPIPVGRVKTKDYGNRKRAKIVYGNGKKKSEENINKNRRNFLNWKKKMNQLKILG